MLLGQTFVRHALAAAVLSSIACGMTGTFVVVKRLSYLGGGIAHAVLGGLGIAVFLGISPVLGALAFAIAAALLIGRASLRHGQQEDTAISAIWAVGMAIGIICISLTSGYATVLQSYLFGNILMVTGKSLLLLGALDCVIACVVILLYHQLVAVSFDREYAALRGMRSDALYLLILCLVAIAVVVLIQTVGIILVIALLSLPAASARLFSRSTGFMMAWSVALSLIFTFTGLALSFAANLPSGASIILVAGAGYLAALGISNRFRSRTAV
jgi:zinc transport system permease protein